MNYFRPHILLLLLLFSINPETVGQVKNYRFHNHTKNLPDTWVDGITQDHKGILWLLSNKSICSYDGNQFRKWGTNNPNLKPLLDYDFGALVEGENGIIWLGTSQGLWGLDITTETLELFQQNPNNDNSLSNNHITDLYFDNKKNLWIGTRGGGLNKLTPQGSFIRYTVSNSKLTSNNIVSIDADKEGNIWLNTRKGVSKLNLKTDTFTSYFERMLDKNGEPIEVMNDILVDSEDMVWAATRNKGLFSINTKNDSITKYVPDPKIEGSINTENAYCLEEDSKGQIWVGTWNYGINIFNKEKNSFTHITRDADNSFGLPSNVVLSIFKDNQDHIWIGTAYDGLFLYDNKDDRFIWYQHSKSNPKSISGNNVQGVLEDKNRNLWVGLNEAGLNNINSKTGNNKVYVGEESKPDRGIIGRTIWALHQDINENLWVGASHGLYKYNQSEDFFKRFAPGVNTPSNWNSDMVYTLNSDRFGNVWVGTWYSGLKKFNPETNELKLYFQDEYDLAVETSHRAIRSLLVDSEDNLWIGFYVGVAKLNIATDSIEFYQYDSENSKSIPNDNVPTLFEDNLGKVWIGTAKGLCYYNSETNDFTRVSLKENNIEPKVDGVIQDNNMNYWIATQEDGLIFLSKKLDEVIYYNENDGIPYSKFSERTAIKRKNGNIVLGTEKGVLEFNPESLEKDNNHYPLLITNFLLTNKKVNVAQEGKLTLAPQFLEELTLDYTDDIFGFEFTSLRYNQEDKVKYQYKLENYNEDWVDTDNKNRRITFIRIPSGKYEFKVRAANDLGEWGEEVSVKIYIKPPWWATTIAKFTWGTLSIGLLVGFYWYRVQSLSRQKINLQREVNKQTNELSIINEEILSQKESIESQANLLIQKNKEIETQKEELLITNEKLLELDNFKQAMTGMIVHDLKNPLNVILGLTEGEFNEKNQKRLNQSGKVMLNLVTNIMEVQKLEEANPQLNITSINLKQLVKESLEDVIILAEDKNIKIQYSIDESIYVTVDVDLITRVIINLLTNAIKYTPQNEEININYALEDKVENQVTLAVTDSGKGIPIESQINIFEKYVQIDMKKSGRTRSTGLGLTFCKLAVEANRGVIGITSEENQGATFWFTMDLDTITKELDSDIEEVQEVLAAEKEGFNFSKNEKALLEPFIERLSGYEVYDLSGIKGVLKEVSAIENDSLKRWVSEVEDTIYASNQEKYNELLDIALS